MALAYNTHTHIYIYIHIIYIGHTDGCMSFLTDDYRMVFTGDALLIRGKAASTWLYYTIHDH